MNNNNWQLKTHNDDWLFMTHTVLRFATMVDKCFVHVFRSLQCKRKAPHLKISFLHPKKVSSQSKSRQCPQCPHIKIFFNFYFKYEKLI